MSSRGYVVIVGSARTYRNEAFLAAAHKLEMPVVLGADVPLPFHARSDARLTLDYRDTARSVTAILDWSRDHPVAAVVGVDDSGTQIAAAAMKALGRPHNDSCSVEAARDKRLMRESFAAAGVPSPAFRVCRIDDDVARLGDQVRYPCVVKPTRLSGSRGVMRADDTTQLAQRFARLARILANERCDEVLIEDYVPGVEVALEGLLDDGRLTTLALFDKPDPLEGPYFEETIYVTPSRLPPAAQQALAAAAEQAARAIGLRHGPVHAELRWNERGPWLIEVAGRSIGGLCSQTLRFGTGLSLEELILRHAAGLDVPAPPRETSAAGVMMIPIPAAGLLRGVSGVEEALAVELVESVEITVSVGGPLVPLPEGDSYLGFVFARGTEPGKVEAALRQAHECLHFDIARAVPTAASPSRCG